MAQYKITLESKKFLVLQEFTIKLKNACIEAISVRTSLQGRAFDSYLQDEMIRQLIVSINGKPIGNVEREDLDILLTPTEYQEVMLCLQDITGGANVKKPKLEILTGNS